MLLCKAILHNCSVQFGPMTVYSSNAWLFATPIVNCGEWFAESSVESLTNQAVVLDESTGQLIMLRDSHSSQSLSPVSSQAAMSEENSVPRVSSQPAPSETSVSSQAALSEEIPVSPVFSQPAPSELSVSSQAAVTKENSVPPVSSQAILSETSVSSQAAVSEEIPVPPVSSQPATKVLTQIAANRKIRLGKAVTRTGIFAALYIIRLRPSQKVTKKKKWFLTCSKLLVVRGDNVKSQGLLLSICQLYSQLLKFHIQLSRSTTTSVIHQPLM